MTWTFDTKRKMMRIVGDGDVTRADLHSLMDAFISEGALGFRVLVDVVGASTSMTSDELLEIGVRTRSIQALGQAGPLAVVLPNDGLANAEQLLGMIAAGQPDMQIFRDLTAAENWIKRRSARAGSSADVEPARSKATNP